MQPGTYGAGRFRVRRYLAARSFQEAVWSRIVMSSCILEAYR